MDQQKLPQELEAEKVYLFGSAIYREGLQFDVGKSDSQILPIGG